jgi:deoxyribodipyrimidine photo-lyase
MEVSTDLIENYSEKRNFPAIKGTSRLGIHLRFGTVSIRTLLKNYLSVNDTWISELIWRDFYSQILAHFPHVAHQSFKPAYDHIPWRNNENEFERWKNGNTGIPIVDAGMRELAQTGFMHNRVRMIVASYLCKNLLIDWRWGEAWFAEKLLDFDLASNNGGWQWAAGSGVDAAPYFRIFNPDLQTKKFDPQLVYCKKWVPEMSSLNYMGNTVVAHDFARNRCLEVYKKALNPVV